MVSVPFGSASSLATASILTWPGRLKAGSTTAATYGARLVTVPASAPLWYAWISFRPVEYPGRWVTRTRSFCAVMAGKRTSLRLARG